jgi:hypothetical protein
VELYRHSPHTYACHGAQLGTWRTLFLEAVEQFKNIVYVLTTTTNNNNNNNNNNNSEWIEMPTPIFGSQ